MRRGDRFRIKDGDELWLLGPASSIGKHRFSSGLQGGGKEEGIHADRGQGLDGEDVFPLLVELLDGGSHVLSTHFHSRSSNTLPFI